MGRPRCLIGGRGRDERTAAGRAWAAGGYWWGWVGACRARRRCPSARARTLAPGFSKRISSSRRALFRVRPPSSRACYICFIGRVREAGRRGLAWPGHARGGAGPTARVRCGAGACSQRWRRERTTVSAPGITAPAEHAYLMSKSDPCAVRGRWMDGWIPWRGVGWWQAF